MDLLKEGASAPNDGVRLLHRLDVREGATGEGDPSQVNVAVVLDVETTGRDPEQDHIIELALRRVRFDGAGVITHVGHTFAWLEDPGWPLEPEITRLTGLTDGRGPDHFGRSPVPRAGS